MGLKECRVGLTKGREDWLKEAVLLPQVLREAASSMME
jgi:hypothetical protein